MKKIKDYLVIDIPIFDDCILYIVGNIGDSVEDCLKKAHKNDNKFFNGIGNTFNIAYSDVRESAKAFVRTATVDKPDGQRSDLVFIKAYDGTERDIVIHECVHAAWGFLDKFGIDINSENHEMLCYLTQYISEQIWNYRDKRKAYLDSIKEKKCEKE